MKYVIDMIDNKCFFVPDDTSEWLQTNDITLKKIVQLIKKKQIGFKRISSGGIDFLNMSKQFNE